MVLQSGIDIDEEVQTPEEEPVETESVTTEPTREVQLLIEAGCGCGDGLISIIRTVPFSSPLKDGDMADSEFNFDTDRLA